MLNILFLNCFLRPNLIFNDKQKERIKYIPSYTIKNNKSLIGLCEVFYDTNLKRLENEYNKKKFNLLRSSDKTSGLAFAYNPEFYKIESSYFEKFNNSKYPDKLMNKGFMYIKILDKLSRNIINIIVTHLQADYILDNKISKKKSEEYRKVQRDQINQISKYIKENLKGENYIIMGDFNIDLDETDINFRLLSEKFNIKVDEIEEKSTCPEYNIIIDYIITNYINSSKTEVINNKYNNIYIYQIIVV